MEPLHLKLRSEVESLYEARPYPPVGFLTPFLQKIRWEERPTMSYRAAYACSYGSTEGAKARPRILVAGSGTFEPVVVALANPGAEILAVDLSKKSLRMLSWQASARGLRGRIEAWAGDFQELPASYGEFDFIVATGVLHHLADPARGLASLVSRLSERGVLRMMVYSYWGRSLLYGAKELARILGVESPAAFRTMIEELPSDHPYKIYFHLYDDARTDTGLADGFLHPCDRPFSALGLRSFLDGAGLVATRFLHAPEGQPEAADRLARLPVDLGSWERLALLEAFGELDRNFILFACRNGWHPKARVDRYEWNPALPKRGRLFSAQAGRELAFDTASDPSVHTPEELKELESALFLLPASKGGV
jgi:SAM-dependent methyltransferase